MRAYYVSRLGIAAILGCVLGLGGLQWWLSAAGAALVLLFFLIAPKSGRYVVRSQGGVAPLRRDERTQAIADKAARNAFIITMLALGGLVVAYGSFVRQPIPSGALGGVLALAFCTYAVSEVLLRRSSRRRSLPDE